MGCCSCKRRQGVTQIPFPSTDLPSSLTHPRRLTSSSGFGGGGGRVDLSILRSRAFFFPAFDLAFFPMVADLFVRSLPLYYYEAVPKIQRSEQETACHRSVHEAATEARRKASERSRRFMRHKIKAQNTTVSLLSRGIQPGKRTDALNFVCTYFRSCTS